MSEEQAAFLHLGIALAIGLLIGVERGWWGRDYEEGQRIAGLRTYGLIGLLGGGTAMLAEAVGALIFGLAFIGVAGMLATAYLARVDTEHDIGITSLIAGLLTFTLGGLAAIGEIAIAGAAAVVTAVILSYKPQLHRWLGALESGELRAGLLLLLISVVLLPVLPNRGYGPWQALNPYAIWWMVVLIAGISFAGYVAVRVGGVQRGIAFTGLFGGLASSTATTLHFSRVARTDRKIPHTISTGVLLACGTMVPRMLLVAAVVNRGLLEPMLLPGIAMSLIIYVPAFFYWRVRSEDKLEVSSALQNPLELKAALAFGALLALVLVLGKGLQDWTGDAGVLALAAASGVTDVDAITLSLARMSQADLSTTVAVTGLFLAAAVNSAVKAGMAAAIAGPAVGVRVAVPLVGASLAALLLVWALLW